MSKATMQTSLWAEEVKEHGLRGALVERLKFHGGMNAAVCADATGASLQTIRHHFAAMVEQGKALFSKPDNTDWIVQAPVTSNAGQTVQVVVRSKGRSKTVLKTEEAFDQLIQNAHRLRGLGLRVERTLIKNGVEVLGVDTFEAYPDRIRFKINDNRERRLYLYASLSQGYYVCYGVGLPGNSCGWYKGLSQATKVLYGLLDDSGAVNQRRKR